MKPILSIKNLTVEFEPPKSRAREKPLRAVDSVNLEVFPGEFVALVGESGSGKTMTSLSIMNLLPEHAKITAGEIEFSGKNKSVIFQEPMTSLNPLMKVGKQITEWATEKGMTKHDAEQKARELAGLIGLKNTQRIFNSYPHELSGGMRQRIMIAGALMTNPELLIADEPTTALDVSTQNEILKIIGTLNKNFKTALLLITHDWTVVQKTCSRIYIMYKGKIVEEGGTEEILSSPKHPYTKALLSAIPTPQKRGRKLPCYFEQEF